MVRLSAVAALAALTACSPTVEYRDRVHRVEVPVAQPCIEELPGPVEYPYLQPGDRTAGENVRLARLGLQLHRRVEADLRELLAGCASLN